MTFFAAIYIIKTRQNNLFPNTPKSDYYLTMIIYLVIMVTPLFYLARHWWRTKTGNQWWTTCDYSFPTIQWRFQHTAREEGATIYAGCELIGRDIFLFGVNIFLLKFHEAEKYRHLEKDKSQFITEIGFPCTYSPYFLTLKSFTTFWHC